MKNKQASASRNSWVGEPIPQSEPQILPSINEGRTVTFKEQPVSLFVDTHPRYIKMLKSHIQPIPVSGPTPVPFDRIVIWKNVCKIGNEIRECIVEMSYTKTKFFIVALDLEINKYHVIDMFRPQANKLIKACSNANEEVVLEKSKEW